MARGVLWRDELVKREPPGRRRLAQEPHVHEKVVRLGLDLRSIGRRLGHLRDCMSQYNPPSKRASSGPWPIHDGTNDDRALTTGDARRALAPESRGLVSKKRTCVARAARARGPARAASRRRHAARSRNCRSSERRYGFGGSYLAPAPRPGGSRGTRRAPGLHRSRPMHGLPRATAAAAHWARAAQGPSARRRAANAAARPTRACAPARSAESGMRVTRGAARQCAATATRGVGS